MSQTEIFESDRAAGYNQFVETWIPNYHYFLNHLPRILQHVEHKSLLCAGCGTGNEIERFVQSTHRWEITGVDPSPEMLRQAREKFRTAPNVTLVDGLVTDLAPEPAFGAATLLLVLHFLKKPEKLNLLKAIADRLKPGGSFVMMDITGEGESFHTNVEILRLLWPDGVDAEQAKARLYRIQHELHHISEENLVHLFTQAGFNPPVRFFQSAVYMGWLATKK